MADHAQKGSADKTHKPTPPVPAAAGPDVMGMGMLESLTFAPALQSPSAAISLQRAAGNAVTHRLIQAKLTVGAAHDPLELEADRVADQVVNRATLQRNPAEADELLAKRVDVSRAPQDEDELMTKRGSPSSGAGQGMLGSFDAGSDFEQQLGSSGSGAPLDGKTRSEMEAGIGADFSKVRVHTGAQASSLNRSISARAFTRGSDVFFDRGQYNPGSTAGKHLLAHELTHVVQQGGAPQSTQRKAYPDAAGMALRTVQPRIQRDDTEDEQSKDEEPDTDDTSSETTADTTPAVTVDEAKLIPQSKKAFDEAEKYSPAYKEARAITSQYMPAKQQQAMTDVQSTFRRWKGTQGEDRTLKDLVRATLLSGYAVPWLHNLYLGEKYKDLPDKKKNQKRDKQYFPNQLKEVVKMRGLLKLGVNSNEVQGFLKGAGFEAAIKGDVEGRSEAIQQGPKIEVMASFIGGATQLRSHLYIVYTGSDGKQFYFRGGPGDDGNTRADYGPYNYGEVDYDPSAPSVTVMSGVEAEGKFDALVEACDAVNSMQVPYVAFEGADNAKSTAAFFMKGLFASRGENCNATAWTILTRAGIPRKKPIGKHTGWGHLLGSITPGKENALPAAETIPETGDDYVLNPLYEQTDENGFVQLYADRAFMRKLSKVSKYSHVQLVGEGRTWRRIKFPDGLIAYVARSQRDMNRADKIRIREYLEDNGWTHPDDLEKWIANKDAGYPEIMAVAQALNVSAQLVMDVMVDQADGAEQVFGDRLGAMSDDEIEAFAVNAREYKGMVAELGIDKDKAQDILDQQLNLVQKNKVLISAIWEEAKDDPVALNYFVNDFRDYPAIAAVADKTGEDFDRVRGYMDYLRPAKNRSHFIIALNDFKPEDMDHETFYTQVSELDVDEAEDLASLEDIADYLGVAVEFVVKRAAVISKYMGEQREAAEEQTRQKRKANAGRLFFTAGTHEDKHSIYPSQDDMIPSDYVDGGAPITILDDSFDPDDSTLHMVHVEYPVFSQKGKGWILNTAITYKAAETETTDEEQPPEKGLSEEMAKKIMQLFDAYSDDVLETVPYGEAATGVTLDDYSRKSDEWVDVRYRMDGYRAKKAQWDELQQALSGTKGTVDTGIVDEEATGESLTERYPAGQYDLADLDGLEVTFGAVPQGPFEYPWTINASLKYSKLVVTDRMTEDHGVGMLWNGGSMPKYVPLEQLFAEEPENSKEDEYDFDVTDEETRDDSGSAAAGGMLVLPEGRTVTFRSMGGESLAELSNGARIDILDEAWPNVDEYSNVMVKNVTTGEMGVLYADELKAYYKSAGDVEEDLEDDDVAPETIEVVEEADSIDDIFTDTEIQVMEGYNDDLQSTIQMMMVSYEKLKHLNPKFYPELAKKIGITVESLQNQIAELY